jgi:hypothetical protein
MRYCAVVDGTGPGARVAIALAGLTASGLCAVAAASADSGQDRRPDLEAVATATEAELVKTVAIEKRAKPSRTTVMSLRMPDLEHVDRFRTTAEITVTNTCVEPGPRCIGRRYRYSPKVGAQLMLAPRRSATAQKKTIRIGARQTLACGQRRPDRNHHCPIVFSIPSRAVNPARLPCRPSACRLNLVLDAHSRKAKRGNRLVIGADRPDGSIDQGRGRIGVIAFRDGFDSTTLRARTEAPRKRFLKMVGGGLGTRQGGHTVTYSAPVPVTERGTVISARAVQRLAIGHLPYSAFVSAELILASRPSRTSPDAVAKRASTFNGHLTETTGFNCTQGPSAFRTPCASRKAGTVQLRREPRRGERAAPLYVNLVSRTFPKRTGAGRRERGRILPGGSLDVVAYPPIRKAD